MSQRQADLLCLLFVAVPAVLGAWLWPALPDPMPSHWNAAGEVDGWMPRFWGVFTVPLAAVGAWLLVRVIPYISPRGFRTDEFPGVLRVLQVAIVGFLSLTGVLVLLEARGVDVHIDRIIMAATGLLFVVIGNYMGKMRKNFFIGIRTPWTLASDEVWSRTHRVGGRLFVLLGAVMIVAPWIGLPVLWTVGAVVVVAFWPIVYSFLLYRRIEGFGNAGDED